VPRRNRDRDRRAARAAEPAGDLGSVGWQQVESGADGEWFVRAVSGTRTSKSYRCPGCDHEIQPGTAHVVVWPADELGTIADRRHWHQSCWQARHRRHHTRRR
jgi:hypothetical protein